jgi:hypothetical protein
MTSSSEAEILSSVFPHRSPHQDYICNLYADYTRTSFCQQIFFSRAATGPINAAAATGTGVFPPHKKRRGKARCHAAPDAIFSYRRLALFI